VNKSAKLNTGQKSAKKVQAHFKSPGPGLTNEDFWRSSSKVQSELKININKDLKLEQVIFFGL
jgi:hypothetical protein